MQHRHGPRAAVLSTVSALLLTLGSAGPATAVDRPTEPRRLTLITTSSGRALADEKGYPLYLRTADLPDRPDCLGSCAKTWPAAVGLPTRAKGVTGDIELTPYDAENSDRPHLIYRTHPLYYFRNDRPKQPMGLRVKGFRLVAPDGRPLAARNGKRSPASPAVTSDGETISATSRPESQAKEKPASPAAKGTAPAKDKPPTAAPTRHSASPGRQAPASRSGSPSPRATARVPAPVLPSGATAASSRAARSSRAATAGAATGGAVTGTTASGVTAGVSASAGALRVTPSGAARGGADHSATAAASGFSGPAALSLTVGAVAAAAGGALLLFRRVRRGSRARHH